jgi:hypothetical protein
VTALVDPSRTIRRHMKVRNRSDFVEEVGFQGLSGADG